MGKGVGGGRGQSCNLQRAPITKDCNYEIC